MMNVNGYVLINSYRQQANCKKLKYTLSLILQNLFY